MKPVHQAERLFGTDGVRGTPNTWPLLPETIVRIGKAAAYYFRCQRPTAPRLPAEPRPTYHPYIQDPLVSAPCTVIIGKDTRVSSYMIESALVAGLVSQGAHVILLGPIPTPAVALLVRSLRADLGIMISASHNPYKDNGIKFFNAEGTKISRDTERAIETLVANNAIPPTDNYGKSMRLDDAAGRYIEFAKRTFPKGMRLSGMRIAIDCANGAAYKVAPRILWELGAAVDICGDTPNGRNINEHCGALHPEMLINRMRTYPVDLGIALDGDADRLLIITPEGQRLNGDQILALVAKQWKTDGALAEGVVSTAVSNLGFRDFLRKENIPWHAAEVGDKNVLERMQQVGANLGGEESGHIILSDYLTTGDGLIAALQVLALLLRSNKHADDLFPVFTPTPQQTRNVPMPRKLSPEEVSTLQGKIQNQLGTGGIVLVRQSGTEPLVRVTIQHSQHSAITPLLMLAEEQLRKLAEAA